MKRRFLVEVDEGILGHKVDADLLAYWIEKGGPRIYRKGLGMPTVTELPNNPDDLGPARTLREKQLDTLCRFW